MAKTGHMHCKECGFHIADGTTVCPLCGGRVVPEDKRNSVGVGFDNDLFARQSNEYFKDENDMFYGDQNLLKNEPKGKTSDYINSMRQRAGYAMPTSGVASVPLGGGAAAYSFQPDARRAKRKAGSKLWLVIVIIMACSALFNIAEENSYEIEDFFNNLFNTSTQAEAPMAESVPTQYYGDMIGGFVESEAAAEGWGEAHLETPGIDNVGEMYIPQSGTGTSISAVCNTACTYYYWDDASEDGENTRYMLYAQFADGTTLQMYFDAADEYNPVVSETLCYMSGDDDPDSYLSFFPEESAKILRGMYEYADVI